MSTSRAVPAVPATGLPAGVEAGPLGRRFVAQLIDVAVPVLIGVVAAVAARSTNGSAVVIVLVGALLVALWLIVVWWMFAVRAAGPGMRAMRLQLVGLRNGRPIGWGRFFVRSLLLAALTVTVVGLLLMLVALVRQPRRQGWHDLVAGSVVIKERPLAPSAAARAATQQPARPPVAQAPRPPSAPQGPPPVAPPGQVPAPQPVSADDAGGAAGASALSPNSVRMPPARRALAPQQPAPQHVQPLVEEPRVPHDARPLDQGWVAVLDDERRVEVTGLVLLGRNPQARPGEDDAELVKVADEARTVSKTHLSLSVDAEGFVVMDRGSTNGTVVTAASGTSRPCLPGEVVPVGDGSIVSFGDHWLKVERRP